MKQLAAWSPQPAHSPGWNDVIAIQCLQLLRRVREHGDGSKSSAADGNMKPSLITDEENVYATYTSEYELPRESASQSISSEQ